MSNQKVIHGNPLVIVAIDAIALLLLPAFVLALGWSTSAAFATLLALILTAGLWYGLLRWYEKDVITFRQHDFSIKGFKLMGSVTLKYNDVTTVERGGVKVGTAPRDISRHITIKTATTNYNIYSRYYDKQLIDEIQKRLK